MKKILQIFTSMGLVFTSVISVVSCDTFENEKNETEKISLEEAKNNTLSYQDFKITDNDEIDLNDFLNKFKKNNPNFKNLKTSDVNINFRLNDNFTVYEDYYYKASIEAKENSNFSDSTTVYFNFLFQNYNRYDERLNLSDKKNVKWDLKEIDHVLKNENEKNSEELWKSILDKFKEFNPKFSEITLNDVSFSNLNDFYSHNNEYRVKMFARRNSKLIKGEVWLSVKIYTNDDFKEKVNVDNWQKTTDLGIIYIPKNRTSPTKKEIVGAISKIYGTSYNEFNYYDFDFSFIKDTSSTSSNSVIIAPKTKNNKISEKTFIMNYKIENYDTLNLNNNVVLEYDYLGDFNKYFSNKESFIEEIKHRFLYKNENLYELEWSQFNYKNNKENKTIELIVKPESEIYLPHTFKFNYTIDEQIDLNEVIENKDLGEILISKNDDLYFKPFPWLENEFIIEKIKNLNPLLEINQIWRSSQSWNTTSNISKIGITAWNNKDFHKYKNQFIDFEIKYEYEKIDFEYSNFIKNKIVKLDEKDKNLKFSLATIIKDWKILNLSDLNYTYILKDDKTASLIISTTRFNRRFNPFFKIINFAFE